MKKSLVALAALAVVSAASAQSSVTIFGRVVLGLVKDTNGQSARLDSANALNQLGFRGVEDLGGGTSALFELRHRFSPESGSMDGTGNARPFWQSTTKVGLRGSFGTVEIGRFLTPARVASGLSDPFLAETVANVDFLSTGYSTDPRAADGAGLARTDQIAYTSPVMGGGFSFALSVGPKTSAAVVPRTVGAKNLVSGWVQYASGPLLLNTGYEQNRFNDKNTFIVGTYNFGPAKLLAGYSQTDNAAVAGPKGKNANLAMSAPFGAITVKAGVGRSEAEGTGLKTTKVGLGAEYALSKRTYFYTDVARTKPAVGARVTGIDFGISHNF